MPNDKNNTNSASVAGKLTFFSASDWVTEAEDFAGSRQDLTSSGDEVDRGGFKKRYPETEKNEVTGERYHPISKVYALSNKKGPVNLDMVAVNVGREKNGKPMGAYLLTTRKKMDGEEHVEQVFLNAHGSFNSLRHDEVVLEPGMPIVSFLGPHKQILFGGLPWSSPYAEVSFEGITLTSKQAMNDFNTSGYKKITGTSTLGAIRNYDVSKFVIKIKDSSVHYLEEVFFFMDEKRQTEAFLSEVRSPQVAKNMRERLGLDERVNPVFDILAIRDSGPDLSTRDMIQIAQKQGYKKIIFNLCRGPENPIFFTIGKPARYASASTELLEQPLFYSWDDIKKLEMEKGRVSENQEAPSCSTPRMSR